MAEHKKDSVPAPGGEAAGKRFEIRTPAPGFRGQRAGVNFNEGVGYTDDEKAAAHCAQCGYTVIPTGSASGDREQAKKEEK